MKITFRVDQKAALLAGIDAPSSTVSLEIIPEQFTPAHRELIAEALKNGHEATGAVFVGAYGHYITLVSPSVDGVRVALDELLSKRQQALLENERAKRENAARRESEIQTLLADCAQPCEQTVSVSLDDTGNVTADRSSMVTVSRNVMALKPITVYSDDPRITRHNMVVSEQLASIRESMLPEARQQLETKRAALAAEKREYDELYARLPELFRQRAADKLATPADIERKISALIRADHGYLPRASAEEWETASVLTDSEYRELQIARETAPSGAEIQLLHLNDIGEQPCEFHSDEFDARCDDCERLETNCRCVARITWSRGGVTAVADLVLANYDEPEAGKSYGEKPSEYAARVRKENV